MEQFKYSLKTALKIDGGMLKVPPFTVGVILLRSSFPIINFIERHVNCVGFLRHLSFKSCSSAWQM